MRCSTPWSCAWALPRSDCRLATSSFWFKICVCARVRLRAAGLTYWVPGWIHLLQLLGGSTAVDMTSPTARDQTGSAPPAPEPAGAAPGGPAAASGSSQTVHPAPSAAPAAGKTPVTPNPRRQPCTAQALHALLCATVHASTCTQITLRLGWLLPVRPHHRCSTCLLATSRF